MEHARKTETKQNPPIELTARESRIRVGGHSRLHPETMEQAGLTAQGAMRVRSGKREVVLSVVPDHTVGTHEVVIRAPDMRRLAATSGAKVRVGTHERLHEATRRQARQAGASAATAARNARAAASRARKRLAKRAKGPRKGAKGARARHDQPPTPAERASPPAARRRGSATRRRS